MRNVLIISDSIKMLIFCTAGHRGGVKIPPFKSYCSRNGNFQQCCPSGSQWEHFKGGYGNGCTENTVCHQQLGKGVNDLKLARNKVLFAKQYFFNQKNLFTGEGDGTTSAIVNQL